MRRNAFDIKLGISFMILALLAGCEGETLPKFSLSATTTTIASGESVQLFIDDIDAKSITWTHNTTTELSDCHNQIQCELTLNEVGSHQFGVSVVFEATEDQLTSVGNSLSSTPPEKVTVDDTIEITVTALERQDPVAATPTTNSLAPATASPSTENTPPPFSFTTPLPWEVTENDATPSEGPQGSSEEAFSFNGKDNYLRGKLPEAHIFGSTATLSAWFRSPGGGEGYPRILEFSDRKGHYQNSTAIAYDRDGSLRAWSTCQLNGTRMAEIDYSEERYNDNQWHHVAYVFDGAEGRLYVDGVLKQIANDDVCDDIYDAETFVIGAYYPNTKHTFKGIIDKAHYYDQVLSAEEIQALYDLHQPLPPPPPPSPAEALSLVPTVLMAYSTDDHLNQPNQAYWFNGQDTRVKGVLEQQLTSAVSLSAWFRSPGGGEGYPRIIEFSDATGHYSRSTAVAYDRDGSLRAWSTCQLTDTRMAEIDYSAERYNDNQWHHVAYVFDGTEGRLYVDGVLKQSANNDVCNDVVDARTFVLGAYYPNLDHSFNGAIGHAMIYNGVLSTTEIQQLAQ